MNLQFLNIVYIFYAHNIVFDQQPKLIVIYVIHSPSSIYFFVSKLKVCFIHENGKIKLEDNYEISTESLLRVFLKEVFYRSISRF